ncbi:MAG TPA: hypothetical protein VLM85_01045 [Polyangiaceae bacterium]|nr:hypothetical protein [Polyangiaceae bacterium]
MILGVAALLLCACGGGGSAFGDGGGVDGSSDGGGAYDGTNPIFGGDGGGGDGGCVNLECAQSCASTQISGYVYDPKGTVPLYNVFVYVPNAPLSPITSGPVCTACQAPASGSPLVSATTDETGHFVLTNVPDGANIPLVLQLGKWRRVLTLPNVQKCVDNRYNTKASPKDTSVESFMRLPKKQGETSPNDNIPLIAVTTGMCDYGECFLLSTIGIDIKEFNTGGRVQIYDGSGGETAYPHSYGNALTNLWNNASNINKYDIIFASCECSTEDRGSGYANIQNYLNGGGRFFGTHYHYNFFANQTQCANSYPDTTCKGPSDFNGVAQWMGDGAATYSGTPFYIDTTFPKGNSMAQWLYNIAGGTLGQINLYETRNDVNMLTTGKATRWIYSDSPGGNASNAYSALYLSFNTPVNNQPANQCGRAVFSDVHVAGTSTGFCQNMDSSYQSNLNALEFLFFDLSSCVQDDTKPPVLPPN